MLLQLNNFIYYFKWLRIYYFPNCRFYFENVKKWMYCNICKWFGSHSAYSTLWRSLFACLPEGSRFDTPPSLVFFFIVKNSSFNLLFNITYLVKSEKLAYKSFLFFEANRKLFKVVLQYFWKWDFSPKNSITIFNKQRIFYNFFVCRLPT